MPAAAQTAGDGARWAELADTIFRVYGPDDGMPTTSATAIAEDGDGFLWIGTQTGLTRWDGYHFRVYHSDPANPRALQNDFIWCLKTDRQGRLWIGTNSGGISRYQAATDNFVSFPTGAPDQGNFPVRSMVEDDAGGMWVGTDRGLDHFDQYGKPLDHATGLPGDQVLALIRDRDGKIWAGTKGGVARQNDGGPVFGVVPLEIADRQEPTVRALHQTGDGRIWAGTRDHGLYVLSPSGRLEKAGAAGQLITSIAEADAGTLWLGTENGGVTAFDETTGRGRSIRHDPTRPSSLPHDFIFSLYRDHSGLMWVATYSGLAMHDPTQSAFRTVFGGSNRTEGLAGADVLATLATREGKVWVSYLAGGADIVDPQGHRLAMLRHDPAHPKNSVPAERIRALAQADNGEVFLGTYHGVYRADPGGGRITALPLSPEMAEPAILSLLPDKSGVWIGTHITGLWHFDQKSGESHRVAVKDFEDQWISALAPAGEGRLWVGSYRGLYLFDPLSGRVQRHLGGIVSALAKDRRGRLWAATLDDGLAIEDGVSDDGQPRLRRFGLTDGLPGLDVTNLLQDHDGILWASIGTGMVARIDPDTLAVRVLQRGDGVGLRGFTMNSGTVTPQGEVLFGGDGGMIVLTPSRLAARDWNPPVVVTELRTGRKQLPFQDRTTLRIEPESNSLSVEFAALDYAAPERNRYAFRLEGFDKDWVPADATRRLASYTNLPPGDYVLHLRGSNRDGVWSEKTLDLPIRVIPAWYQTLVFRATVAVVALLCIWLLVRARTSYLRHRQGVLEDLVSERTTELGRSLEAVAESRAKVASLLDSSGQGFLSFGADLVVEPDYSRACETMLGCVPVGRRADELMFGRDSAKAELFRKVIAGAMASDDLFKRDLFFSLLPATAEPQGRVLKVEYRRLENAHLMVVLTDVTEEYRLSRKVESERRNMAMIVMAVTESRDFFDALESYRQFFRHDLAEILSTLSSPLAVHREIYRQVHTFKGTLAQFSFSATPRILHDLEEGLSALKQQPESLTAGKIVELVLSVDFHQALETDLDVLRNALGYDFLEHGRGVFLPLSQARQLRIAAEKLLAGEVLHPGSAETRALFAEFRHLDKITLSDALKLYDRVVIQLAQRLDKEVEPLRIRGGDDLRLDPERYGPFLRSLIHVFRNAVVHGIEEPEDRLAKGKFIAGRIECDVEHEGAAFTLTIADDGAGIDTAALGKKAAALGLVPPELAATLPHEDAVALIFADDISVKNRADDLAGRGVGLAAVRAEITALGGDIAVLSTPGQGTRFIFSIPWSEDVETERSAG